jgi:multiple sugar transport system substrate-binding protein
VLTLTATATGCRQQSEKGETGSVRLVFWHGIESTFSSGLLENKIREFQKAHPHITIELQHYGAADQVKGKIMTAIAGKRPPDMLWWGPQALGYLARSDALLKIQDLIDRDADFHTEAIHDRLWDLCKYRDTIYAVPFDTNNLALYYNRAHFEREGIDPRQLQTWADLRETAKRLTKDIDGDGRIDRYGFQIPLGNGEWTVWTWQTFLWQAGGEFMDRDLSRSLFDKTAGVKALQFWVDLVHKHQGANFSEPGAGYKVDDFVAGRISMMINGPWNFNLLEEARQKNDLDYGALFLPRDERIATNIGGENLYIFKSESRREDAAWSFAKFIMSAAFQVDWAMQTGYLPVNRRAIEDGNYQQFLKTHPFIRTFVDQIPYARARPTIPEYAKISTKLGKQIEIALYQKESPQKALKAAATYADKVLAER